MVTKLEKLRKKVKRERKEAGERAETRTLSRDLRKLQFVKKRPRLAKAGRVAKRVGSVAGRTGVILARGTAGALLPRPKRRIVKRRRAVTKVQTIIVPATVAQPARRRKRRTVRRLRPTRFMGSVGTPAFDESSLVG